MCVMEAGLPWTLPEEGCRGIHLHRLVWRVLDATDQSKYSVGIR